MFPITEMSLFFSVTPETSPLRTQTLSGAPSSSTCHNVPFPFSSLPIPHLQPPLTLLIFKISLFSSLPWLWHRQPKLPALRSPLVSRCPSPAGANSWLLVGITRTVFQAPKVFVDPKGEYQGTKQHYPKQFPVSSQGLILFSFAWGWMRINFVLVN